MTILWQQTCIFLTAEDFQLYQAYTNRCRQKIKREWTCAAFSFWETYEWWCEFYSPV